MALLDKAENVRGKLDPETKAQICAFLEHPTVEGWGYVRNLIINPSSLRCSTVWQAVTAADPTFPRAGQPDVRVPDAILVARAIKAATR